MCVFTQKVVEPILTLLSALLPVLLSASVTQIKFFHSFFFQSFVGLLTDGRFPVKEFLSGKRKKKKKFRRVSCDQTAVSGLACPSFTLIAPSIPPPPFRFEICVTTTWRVVRGK